MRNKDTVFGKFNNVLCNFIKLRRILHHLVVNPGKIYDKWRYCHFRVYKCQKFINNRHAIMLVDSNLRNFGILWTSPRCFYVDYCVKHSCKVKEKAIAFDPTPSHGRALIIIVSLNTQEKALAFPACLQQSDRNPALLQESCLTRATFFLHHILQMLFFCAFCAFCEWKNKLFFLMKLLIHFINTIFKTINKKAWTKKRNICIDSCSV